MRFPRVRAPSIPDGCPDPGAPPVVGYADFYRDQD